MDVSAPRSPVFARSQIVVGDDVRHVWTVLAQIDDWAAWNPGVRTARLNGGLEVGTGFHWEAGPSTYTCTLTEVDAPWHLAWRGRSLGVAHARSSRLEQHDRGCLVTVDGAISGPLAYLLAGRLQQWLQRELDTWSQLLKLEAEARTLDDVMPIGSQHVTTDFDRTGASNGRVS